MAEHRPTSRYKQHSIVRIVVRLIDWLSALSSISHTSSTLLENIRSHDQQAWEQFVDHYGPTLFRWCRSARLDDTDCADVIQETFRSVAKGIGRFERETGQTGSFTAWLWKVTQSKIQNHRQRIARHEPAIGGSEAQQYMSALPDPFSGDDTLDVADDTSFVMCATEGIRSEFKETTWLAFWRVAVDDQPTDIVAKQLNISVAAVRQANYRVRRRLRTELQIINGDDYDGN